MDFRHWAGAWVGNWDIMVIIEALKQKGLGVAQHIVFNRASGQAAENKFDADLQQLRERVKEGKTIGIIVNVRSPTFILKIFSGHHWYSLRPSTPTSPEEPRWYNTDSKLRTPQLVGGDGTVEGLAAFLRQQGYDREAQIFVVVEANMMALRDDPDPDQISKIDLPGAAAGASDSMDMAGAAAAPALFSAPAAGGARTVPVKEEES